MIGTEVFYMWKVPVIDRDNPKRERLLNPHGDPLLYEYPVDYQFDNIRAAIDWRDEELDDADEKADDDRCQEMRSWVLVKVTYEPVDDVAASWQETAARILAARESHE